MLDYWRRIDVGLADLISANVAAARLTFSTDLPASVKGVGAIFIAVVEMHILAWADKSLRLPKSSGE
jgi:hypothetical protein